MFQNDSPPPSKCACFLAQCCAFTNHLPSPCCDLTHVWGDYEWKVVYPSTPRSHGASSRRPPQKHSGGNVAPSFVQFVVNWNYIMLIFHSCKFKTTCSAREGRGLNNATHHSSPRSWKYWDLPLPLPWSSLRFRSLLQGERPSLLRGVWCLLIQDYSFITQGLQQACCFVCCSARGTPILLRCLAASRTVSSTILEIQGTFSGNIVSR